MLCTLFTFPLLSLCSLALFFYFTSSIWFHSHSYIQTRALSHSRFPSFRPLSRLLALRLIYVILASCHASSLFVFVANRNVCTFSFSFLLVNSVLFFTINWYQIKRFIIACLLQIPTRGRHDRSICKTIALFYCLRSSAHKMYCEIDMVYLDSFSSFCLFFLIKWNHLNK